MKFFIFLALLTSSLFAFGEKIQSFEADFVQVITDEENKTLKYKGKIYSQRPNQVMWHYTDPINKKIFIQDRRAVIIEPELEQAIIKRLQGELDFFTILTSAKTTDNTYYKTNYKDIDFTLKVVENKIESLMYVDQLENKVQITFSNQKQNSPIRADTFSPYIPLDYDVIKE